MTEEEEYDESYVEEEEPQPRGRYVGDANYRYRTTHKSRYYRKKGYCYTPSVLIPDTFRPFSPPKFKVRPTNPFRDQYRRKYRR